MYLERRVLIIIGVLPVLLLAGAVWILTTHCKQQVKDTEEIVRAADARLLDIERSNRPEAERIGRDVQGFLGNGPFRCAWVIIGGKRDTRVPVEYTPRLTREETLAAGDYQTVTAGEALVSKDTVLVGRRFTGDLVATKSDHLCRQPANP